MITDLKSEEEKKKTHTLGTVEQHTAEIGAAQFRCKQICRQGMCAIEVPAEVT